MAGGYVYVHRPLKNMRVEMWEWKMEDAPVACRPCTGFDLTAPMFISECGKECEMCGTPFRVFKWRPCRSLVRRTVICQTCCVAKHICQVCTLPLKPKERDSSGQAAEASAPQANGDVGPARMPDEPETSAGPARQRKEPESSAVGPARKRKEPESAAVGPAKGEEPESDAAPAHKREELESSDAPQATGREDQQS